MKKLGLSVVLATGVLACEARVKAPENLPPDIVIPDCTIGPTPLRRLTHEEYVGTVQAAFPTANLPALQFPQDPSPYGYDNDHRALNVNGLLLEAYLAAAETLAPQLAPLALQRVDCNGRTAPECGWVFATYWAERLYRRPPDADQINAISHLFIEGEPLELNAAVALQAMLLEPEFLYHMEYPAASDLEPGAYLLDGWSVAARLSYTLWRAPPDAALREAARTGKLETEDEVRAQAERLLNGPLARRGVRHFFSQWLDLDRLDETTKLAIDGFDDATRESMRQETLQLIEHLVFETPGTVADVLASNETFVDRRLAGLYGIGAPNAEGFQKVPTAPGRRGVLTHASFLASHSHPGYKSPVLRGAFVLRNILCQPLGAPPPEAEGSMVPTDDQSLATNRERYDSVTLQSETCASCHRSINNAGYAFEGFDTMGRSQTEESGTRIDTSGTLGDLAYQNADELVTQLAADPRVSSCLTQHFLRYAYGGNESGQNGCVRLEVEEQVAQTQGTLRDVILAAVTHSEFRILRINPDNGGSP